MSIAGKVRTIAELDIWGKAQPSADWGTDRKSQNENAGLVFRQ